MSRIFVDGPPCGEPIKRVSTASMYSVQSVMFFVESDDRVAIQRVRSDIISLKRLAVEKQKQWCSKS